MSSGVPIFKIASMDINNLALLGSVATRKRGSHPFDWHVNFGGDRTSDPGVVHAAGSGPIALLHCISIYPPTMETIHLRNIPTLQGSIRRSGRF